MERVGPQRQHPVADDEGIGGCVDEIERGVAVLRHIHDVLSGK
jgi:hypothetical protein